MVLDSAIVVCLIHSLKYGNPNIAIITDSDNGALH